MRTPLSPPTRRGLRSSARWPWPSVPLSFQPQDQTWPSASIASVLRLPAMSGVPGKPRLGCAQGVWEFVSSCRRDHASAELPSELPYTAGHTATAPRRQQAPVPAAHPISCSPSSASTTFGALQSAMVSSPSWWSSEAPHAKTTASTGGMRAKEGSARQSAPTGESAGGHACARGLGAPPPPWGSPVIAAAWWGPGGVAEGVQGDGAVCKQHVDGSSEQRRRGGATALCPELPGAPPAPCCTLIGVGCSLLLLGGAGGQGLTWQGACRAILRQVRSRVAKDGGMGGKATLQCTDAANFYKLGALSGELGRSVRSHSRSLVIVTAPRGFSVIPLAPKLMFP